MEDSRPGQARDLPLDDHLHTDLSPDSKVPLELYAAQAFERGIPEIAITDHLDFMPGAPAYEYADYGKREMIVASSPPWRVHSVARYDAAFAGTVIGYRSEQFAATFSRR